MRYFLTHCALRLWQKGNWLARNGEVEAGYEAVPSPQWVMTAGLSLQEQPAIVIGNQCGEQRHQVSDRVAESSNRKVVPRARLKGQGQVKKSRIEHQRGRQIEQSAHANHHRDYRERDEQECGARTSAASGG